MQTTYALLELN